ncbi:MAG: DMT family transporter [Deltaproteobacteria bacterium]|nr:DMT family transporter [Deltaproteobacteria bacterium]
MDTNPTKATFLALATVGIWSTVASAFKISLLHVEPVQLLFWSSLFSALALGLILLKRSGPAGLLAVFRRNGLKTSALFGLLNPFAYYLVLFKAYDLLPAQEAQTLNYTWGITLALLAVFLLGQKLTIKELVGIVVSYMGVLVIATRGNPWSLEFESPLGVGLALGSTLIWSLYWIYNTKDRMDPVARLFLNFCFGLVYAAVWAVFNGGYSFGGLVGLAGCAYVGVFEMGVTYVLWLSALRLARSAAQVSHYIYLSPFLSLVFIRFVVGERILVSTLAGLVLILAGLAIKALPGRRASGNNA